MTIQSNSRALRRWFTIVTIAIVLLAVGLILRPMAMTIAWAAILGFLMQPLQARLMRRLGNRPSVAAGVLTALTPIALFLPLAFLGAAFAKQVAAIAMTLQDNPGLLDLSTWLDARRHPSIAKMFSWISRNFEISRGEARAYFSENVQQWAGVLAASSGKMVLNVAGTALKFFLMLFVLFFMLRDGSRWFQRLSSLLPLQKSRRDELMGRLGKVTRAVVYGCGVTAAVQGTLVGIGFAITGLAAPVVFAVVATVSALLPFGGAALVWLPGALYLLGTGKTGLGIFLLAWGGLVSISDNFVRPMIISRYTPVPTLLVFLGVIGGIAAFGVIGFIAGPVILVMATELLRFAEGSLAHND